MCVISSNTLTYNQNNVKRTNSSNGTASKGGQLSIAQKLEVRGLDIKYKGYTQNPHSAPFRRPSVRENYEDPIKNFKVFPAGKKSDAEYAVYTRLYTSVRILVEDIMLEIEDNYFKNTLNTSSYLDKSEGEFEIMKEYFTKDKFGLTEVNRHNRHPLLEVRS